MISDTEMEVLSLTTEMMQQHKDFLRTIHSVSGGGNNLYIGHGLPVAIDRYLRFWLPLVADQIKSKEIGNESEFEGNKLVPPVDIAWVWHLHRLAPLRYASYCKSQFGQILNPGEGGAFTVQYQGQDFQNDRLKALALETQRLWNEAYVGEPFFTFTAAVTEDLKDVDSIVTQTTMHEQVRSECDRVRDALNFDFDIGKCSSRQRTFLWHISQSSFENAEFLSSSIKRYAQFLHLMKVNGYHKHFFVPSYDIDFAWHTHILASTSKYMCESAELAAAYPDGVDHDDSIDIERTEGSKLDVSWNNTKNLWNDTYTKRDRVSEDHISIRIDTVDISDVAEELSIPEKSTVDQIDKVGTSYRGEPPSWWFKDSESIIQVHDNFLREDEIIKFLSDMAKAESVLDISPKGFERTVLADASVERRIKSIMDGDSPNGVTIKDSGNNIMDVGKKRIPARVCPSHMSVPLHKDKYDGVGPAVDTWVCLVYLTEHGDSNLVLVDDIDKTEHKIDIVKGRIVCWPNARFSHRIDTANENTVDLEARNGNIKFNAGMDTMIKNCRCMLGPMALKSEEGNNYFLSRTGGGCGGGGCGGGCGGGGAIGNGGNKGNNGNTAFCIFVVIIVLIIVIILNNV